MTSSKCLFNADANECDAKASNFDGDEEDEKVLPAETLDSVNEKESGEKTSRTPERGKSLTQETGCSITHVNENTSLTHSFTRVLCDANSYASLFAHFERSKYGRGRRG